MTLQNTTTERIDALVKAQKGFFANHATRDLAFRREMLRRFGEGLYKLLIAH